jgi:hypothetical protein
MHAGALDGWAGLAALVDKHKGQNWIYRGQTPGHIELIPKIGRKGARKNHRGRSLPYSEPHERWLLEEFKRKARPLLAVEPETDLEWMAVAQHHGLKTRLLDWTESLLVAAMFATEKGVARRIDKRTGMEILASPCIYGIQGLPEADRRNDPFRLKNVKVYRPAHISDRIAPQQAVFTVHPRVDKDFTHPRLFRWVLLITGTLDMKLALDAVGINRAALFPGIDGLAEALNWRHKWGTLRG